MRRRKLVATAGALSVTAFAATVAIGANFGLVSRADPSSPVGRLDDRDHQVVTAVGVGPVSTTPVTTPALGPNADD